MRFYFPYFWFCTVVFCIGIGAFCPYIGEVIWEEIVAHVGHVDDFVLVEKTKGSCHQHFRFIANKLLVLWILGWLKDSFDVISCWIISKLRWQSGVLLFGMVFAFLLHGRNEIAIMKWWWCWWFDSINGGSE